MQAEREGYRPDCYVTSDEVRRGRPGPAMIYLNMVRLDVFPVQVQKIFRKNSVSSFTLVFSDH